MKARDKKMARSRPFQRAILVKVNDSAVMYPAFKVGHG